MNPAITVSPVEAVERSVRFALDVPGASRDHDVWNDEAVLQAFVGNPDFQRVLGELGMPDPELRIFPVTDLGWPFPELPLYR